MEVLILQALRDKRRFTTLSHAVPTDMVSQETAALLTWYNAYFQTYTEHTYVDSECLRSLIMTRGQSLGKEAVELILRLAAEIDRPEDKGAIEGIVARLYELDFSGRAGALITKYNQNEEVDLVFELSQLANKARRDMVEGSGASWLQKSLADCLAADSEEGGLQLTSIPALQQSIKGLVTGDNIAIAAPTDKGKTSLVCRITHDLHVQGIRLYPNRPMLYLVNEGKEERIKIRMYQTALGVDRMGLHEMDRLGVAERRVADLWGDLDSVRIVSVHGKSIAQVMSIVQQHNPYMVVTDMTGRIRSTSNRGGMNDISQLEEVWNIMREEATLQDFLHIGTVQVSAEGFDMLFPPLSAMQNSKTGIQTTLDLAIMMGALRDPQFANLRGISTPKNKLSRSGMKGEVQATVMFNGHNNTWVQEGGAIPIP